MGYTQMNRSPPVLVVSAVPRGAGLNSIPLAVKEIKFEVNEIWRPIGIYQDRVGTIIAFINLLVLMVAMASFSIVGNRYLKGKMIKQIKYS